MTDNKHQPMGALILFAVVAAVIIVLGWQWVFDGIKKSTTICTIAGGTLNMITNKCYDAYGNEIRTKK